MKIQARLIVATEDVRHGLGVAVITIPYFPLWTPLEGLAAGGPAAYECHDVNVI